MTPRAITWLRRYGVFVAWAGACALGYGLFPDLYERWQLDLSSRTQELRGPRKPPSGVVIVGIDDYSLVQGQNADLSQDKDLRRLAAWPWPRAIYDRVLDRLFSAGARVVGFDLLFDAPSSHGPEDDAALAAALRRHSGKVVLGAQVFESRGRVGGLTLSAAMPFLSEAAGPRSSGLLNGLQDPDGYIRLRPSTYAEQLRQSGMLDVPVGLSSQLIAKGRLAEIPPPPILSNWRPLVDPYGPPRTIPTIPIWEVLETGSFARLQQQGTFRNQVVLIGPTAGVLQDIHRTAFAGAEGMPGVEIHAAEIANRLEGRALYIPPTAWYVAPLLGLLGLILLSSTGAGIGLLGLSAVTFATGLVSAGDATVRLQWNRLRLRRMLERYLSPAVAAQIASQPEEADELLGGKVSEVVVFICDVRGFTQRTTKMSKEGKATELVQQLNEYFAVVVDTLQRKGAIIDKYMGDAVLAVFGVPLSRGMTVEVQSALEAILELQDQMEALNQRWAAQGKDPWEQVMILSGGPVISGNIGCASRMDYTVIGDTVNMASRLEGVAKQSGREIILSRVVAEHASPEWGLERVGEFEIRGQGAQEVFTMKPSDYYERSQS